MSESLVDPKYAHFYKPHWDTFKVVGCVASFQDTVDCKVQCKARPMLIICEGKGRCGTIEYLVLPLTTKKKDGDFSVGKAFSDKDSHAMLKCVEWLGDSLIQQRHGKKFKHCDRQLYDGIVKIAMDHRQKTTFAAITSLVPEPKEAQGKSPKSNFVPLYQHRKK